MLVMLMIALLGLVFAICVNVAKGLTGKICLLECRTHLAAVSLCLLVVPVWDLQGRFLDNTFKRFYTNQCL